MLPKASKLCY